ncbi:hypothetical protein GCM10010151_31630 [Actinoallomurus spadix]|uniref:Transposase n=1 Tax=Actinoallomurus spadix TaxID=79912 RepID=A0ABN0WJE4_9ACTN
MFRSGGHRSAPEDSLAALSTWFENHRAHRKADAAYQAGTAGTARRGKAFADRFPERVEGSHGARPEDPLGVGGRAATPGRRSAGLVDRLG